MRSAGCSCARYSIERSSVPSRARLDLAASSNALVEGIAELEIGAGRARSGEGDLGSLYSLYLDELKRLDLADRELERWLVVEQMATEPDTWPAERPLFVHGFEDLTGAQWRLLDLLAARAEVSVALPYEPGRAAFAALARTQQELARRASGRISELPARSSEYAQPALAFVERRLFRARRRGGAGDRGRRSFPRGLGRTGDLRAGRRGGAGATQAGCRGRRDRRHLPLARAPQSFARDGFYDLRASYALEGRVKLAQLPFGHALCGLLRFVWLGGGRSDLFSFVRSPYSEVTRASADYLEGRLRGRGIHSPGRIESELISLRNGRRLTDLELLEAADSSLQVVRELSTLMLKRASGLESPPVSERARLELRAHESVRALLDELESWQELSGQALGRDDLVAALERASVSIGSADEPDRVVVSDLLQARGAPVQGCLRGSGWRRAVFRAAPRSTSYSATRRARSWSRR